MHVKTSGSFTDILTSPKYLPCVSLIMPFDPKMGLKKELDYKLKIASEKIEKELLSNFPSEKIIPVFKKLQNAIHHLNYYTHKKSIAIFVSPLIEKVYYLDIQVEEKIIIDESFEIRDLIYSKKQIQKYLLAVLSSKEVRIFIGNTTHFIKITSNVPDHVEAFKTDAPEKIANFTDENKRKEVLLDKFMRHTDNGLTLLLQAYKLPLFVIGTEKTMGHFKSITHNAKTIIEYISGGFEEKNENELLGIMKPHVENWKKVIQKNLLNQINDSLSKKKLAIGIENVWKAAYQKKGRLLVVEKNYIYPAEHTDQPDSIFKRDQQAKNSFYIKDAVDDVIEKVLSSGGEVEFVDEGVLKQYQQIALIEYYS